MAKDDKGKQNNHKIMSITMGQEQTMATWDGWALGSIVGDVKRKIRMQENDSGVRKDEYARVLKRKLRDTIKDKKH